MEWRVERRREDAGACDRDVEGRGWWLVGGWYEGWAGWYEGSGVRGIEGAGDIERGLVWDDAADHHQ